MDVNFECQDFLRNPWPTYRELQTSDPIFWSERYSAWIFTRHRDIVEALRSDGVRFSADRIEPWVRQIEGVNPRDYPCLFKYFMTQFGDRDGADHARIRRIFMKSFGVKAAQSLRPMAARVIHALLDEVKPNEKIDFQSEVGVHLPTRVLAEFIGVPQELRASFHDWSVGAQEALTKAAVQPQDLAQLENCLAAMTEALLEECSKRRVTPEDDLLTLCVRARDEDGRLSDEEVISSAQVITFAAFDTTVHSMSLGLRALCRRRDVVDHMLSSDAHVMPVVNELLRYNSPVRGMIRIALADFEMHGKTIRKGDIVYLMFDAANHDPEVWEDPDELRLGRDHRASLVFGTGPHGCLGQNIARVELAEFFPALFRKFPNTIIEDDDFAYLQSFAFRGSKKLPVILRT